VNVLYINRGVDTFDPQPAEITGIDNNIATVVVDPNGDGRSFQPYLKRFMDTVHHNTGVYGTRHPSTNAKDT